LKRKLQSMVHPKIDNHLEQPWVYGDLCTYHSP